MIRLIENNDFDGKVYKIFSGSENATEYLNEIIDKYQEKILKQILGNIEYYNLTQDITDGALTTQKWIDFVKGTDYIVNDIHYNYKGIEPVLIDFIYYYWQRHTVSILAENGELSLNNKNSKKVIPVSKMNEAYNNAIDKIQSNDLYEPTVYHYLKNHDFDNWYFTEFEKLNLFGI